MIIRTEAIVLRSMNYGETSQIVTLFTRDRGKVSVIAKGARRTKSRFGSSLQPMSYTQAIFYYKPTRTLQTLSDSAHVVAFHDIHRRLEKISTGLRIVELAHALVQDEQANPMVFNLLLQVLYQLNETEARVDNLLPYFQLRLAAMLGFAPAIDRAAVQDLPEEGGMLALDSGEVLPSRHATRAGYRASRTALRAFAIAARADLDTVMRMRLEPEVRIELSQLVEDFLRYHVEDAYPSRSNKIIGQLLTSPNQAP